MEAAPPSTGSAPKQRIPNDLYRVYSLSGQKELKRSRNGEKTASKSAATPICIPEKNDPRPAARRVVQLSSMFTGPAPGADTTGLIICETEFHLGCKRAVQMQHIHSSSHRAQIGVSAVAVAVSVSVSISVSISVLVSIVVPVVVSVAISVHAAVAISVSARWAI